MHRPTEREKPFKACPDLSCRRINTCQNLAPQKNCLKTHFRNDDEWFDFMADKISRITRRYGSKHQEEPDMTEDEALSHMYKLFQERLLEFEAEDAAKAGKTPARQGR